jgi:hypothetical protein
VGALNAIRTVNAAYATWLKVPSRIELSFRRCAEGYFPASSASADIRLTWPRNPESESNSESDRISSVHVTSVGFPACTGGVGNLFWAPSAGPASTDGGGPNKNAYSTVGISFRRKLGGAELVGYYASLISRGGVRLVAELTEHCNGSQMGICIDVLSKLSNRFQFC